MHHSSKGAPETGGGGGKIYSEQVWKCAISPGFGIYHLMMYANELHEMALDVYLYKCVPLDVAINLWFACRHVTWWKSLGLFTATVPPPFFFPPPPTQELVINET